MKTMIILTLIAVAAADMTCSISCTHDTATNIIKVLHDTTTAHTHHRCFNDPTANVCRCECCTDTIDDCSDTSNYVNNPVCAAGFHAVPQNDVNGVCVACSSGTFDNNADGLGVCEDHTQCTSIYEHLDGHSDTAAGSCTENICSCANGTPVANDSCTSHGDDQCSSCTSSYHLSEGTNYMLATINTCSSPSTFIDTAAACESAAAVVYTDDTTSRSPTGYNGPNHIWSPIGCYVYSGSLYFNSQTDKETDESDTRQSLCQTVAAPTCVAN